MKKTYLLIIDETGKHVRKLVICEDCRFFRKNFRQRFMSPSGDESPHACIHKNGLWNPWENDWCSYGKEKDHE